MNTNRIVLNKGEEEYYTPRHFIESVKLVMGEIDLDPASNQLSNSYINAKTFYTIDDNGLSKEWCGKVFMNPPYNSKKLNLFIEKLINSELVSEFITLTNNNTETKIIQSLLDYSDAICLVKGRIKFLNEFEDVTKQPPLQGQLFCYKGKNKSLFKEEFSKHGVVFIKG